MRFILSGVDTYSETVELIKSSRVRQTELARRTGLTPTAINRWLYGRVTSISPSNVEAVATALGKQVIWKNDDRTECEFRDVPESATGEFDQDIARGLLHRILNWKERLKISSYHRMEIVYQNRLVCRLLRMDPATI